MIGLNFHQWITASKRNRYILFAAGFQCSSVVVQHNVYSVEFQLAQTSTLIKHFKRRCTRPRARIPEYSARCINISCVYPVRDRSKVREHKEPRAICAYNIEHVVETVQAVQSKGKAESGVFRLRYGSGKNDVEFSFLSSLVRLARTLFCIENYHPSSTDWRLVRSRIRSGLFINYEINYGQWRAERRNAVNFKIEAKLSAKSNETFMTAATVWSIDATAFTRLPRKSN